ncbi:MAG: hypothetical protein NXI32_10265 [bacterium]|nr:hypothetical protein [bacterium]
MHKATSRKILSSLCAGISAVILCGCQSQPQRSTATPSPDQLWQLPTVQTGLPFKGREITPADQNPRLSSVRQAGGSAAASFASARSGPSMGATAIPVSAIEHLQPYTSRTNAIQVASDITLEEDTTQVPDITLPPEVDQGLIQAARPVLMDNQESSNSATATPRAE